MAPQQFHMWTTAVFILRCIALDVDEVTEGPALTIFENDVSRPDASASVLQLEVQPSGGISAGADSVINAQEESTPAHISFRRGTKPIEPKDDVKVVDSKAATNASKTAALGIQPLQGTAKATEQRRLPSGDVLTTTAEIAKTNATSETSVNTTVRLANKTNTTVQLTQNGTTAVQLANKTNTTVQLTQNDTAAVQLANKTNATVQLTQNGTTTLQLANKTNTTVQLTQNGTTAVQLANKTNMTVQLANRTAKITVTSEMAIATNDTKSKKELAINTTKSESQMLNDTQLAKNDTQGTRQLVSKNDTAVLNDKSEMKTIKSHKNLNMADSTRTFARGGSTSEADRLMRKEAMKRAIESSGRGDVVAGTTTTTTASATASAAAMQVKDTAVKVDTTPAPLKTQLTEALQSSKVQSSSWTSDVLVLSAGVFLYPAHCAGRASMTWLSFLFATQALVGGLFSYCDVHHLTTQIDGPTCPESTYNFLQYAIRGIYYFVFLQVAFLLSGPEDSILQRLIPTSGFAYLNNIDLLGMPFPVFLLNRALPVAVFALMFSFILVGDHAVGSTIFHAELLGATCAAFIVVVGTFWISRPVAAAKVLTEQRIWLRMALGMVFATVGVVSHVALAPKDMNPSIDKATADIVWNAVVAVMAALVIQASCWQSLSFNDMEKMVVDGVRLIQ